jgi:hypothetical protein
LFSVAPPVRGQVSGRAEKGGGRAQPHRPFSPRHRLSRLPPSPALDDEQSASRPIDHRDRCPGPPARAAGPRCITAGPTLTRRLLTPQAYVVGTGQVIQFPLPAQAARDLRPGLTCLHHRLLRCRNPSDPWEQHRCNGWGGGGFFEV